VEIDYPVSQLQSQAEIEYREYEHQQWEEDPQSWSPLINLEQLEKRPDLEIEWYCPDWIPVGAKTILSAEPKTGKTILLFHILKAVTEGGEFLGKPCPPTRVLYLTEQTEQEYKRQICEVPGLIGNPNFYVLLAEEQPQELKTWEDMIDFAERYLAITKAKILVVDTFGGLAKLPPNGENDAAVIQNNINKLNRLFKNRYLSVVLTHHNRKKSEDPRAGGSNLSINSARGSSAFVGGGGHLVFMSAPDKSCQRNFTFFGRYNHGMEKTLYLINSHYQESQYVTASRRS
jgi:RecA-family ATPase